MHFFSFSTCSVWHECQVTVPFATIMLENCMPLLANRSSWAPQAALPGPPGSPLKGASYTFGSHQFDIQKVSQRSKSISIKWWLWDDLGNEAVSLDCGHSHGFDVCSDDFSASSVIGMKTWAEFDGTSCCASDLPTNSSPKRGICGVGQSVLEQKVRAKLNELDGKGLVLGAQVGAATFWVWQAETQRADWVWKTTCTYGQHSIRVSLHFYAANRLDIFEIGMFMQLLLAGGCLGPAFGHSRGVLVQCSLWSHRHVPWGAYLWSNSFLGFSVGLPILIHLGDGVVTCC